MRGCYVDFVTFGSPRPGNVIFANIVNRAVRGLTLKVTFVKDIATVVPSKRQVFLMLVRKYTVHKAPGYVDYDYGALI